MAKKTRFLTDLGNVGKRFTLKELNKRVVKVKAAEALTTKRWIHITANWDALQANNDYLRPNALPISQGDIAVNKILNAITKGAGIGEAYSTLEAGLGAQVGPSGYTCNTNFVGSGTAFVNQAAIAGLSSEMTATNANAETLVVDSASASDTNYMACFGTNAAGAAIYEIIKMNGTTAVTGSTAFTALYGAIILDQNDLIRGTGTAAVGSVTIVNSTTATALITIAATAKSAGLTDIASATRKSFDRRLLITASALTGAPLPIIVGQDYAGDVALELITFVAANDILVKETVNRYAKARFLVSGEYGTRTIAITSARPEEVYVGVSNTKEDGTITGLTQLAETIGFKSDVAGDTGVVKLFAVDASNNITVEDVTLTGTTLSESTASDLTEVFAIVLDSTVIGSVTAYDGNDDTTVLVVLDGLTHRTLGVLSKDATAAVNMRCGRMAKVKITCSNAAATDELIIRGLDKYGTAQNEFVTLSSGTITSANYYSRIDYIVNLTCETTEYFTIDAVDTTDGIHNLGNVKTPADSQGTDVEVDVR